MASPILVAPDLTPSEGGARLLEQVWAQRPSAHVDESSDAANPLRSSFMEPLRQSRGKNARLAAVHTEIQLDNLSQCDGPSVVAIDRATNDIFSCGVECKVALQHQGFLAATRVIYGPMWSLNTLAPKYSCELR